MVGVVIAGPGDLKSELVKCKSLHPKLSVAILAVLDICGDGNNGFNEAVSLAAGVLGDVRFLHERALLKRYFSEIAKDSGKYCFGVKATLTLMESGAVETLICWEDLAIQRPDSQDQTLSAWLADNHTQFGVTLEFVGNSSPEGSQFVNGFGGLGGILRYPCPFVDEAED